MNEPSAIRFDIVYPGAQKGDYGSCEDPSSYVQLVDPDRDLAGMLNKSDIVISEPEIIIDFSYPLGSTFNFRFRAPTDEGFTREDLARMISQKYQEIYNEEDKTSETIAGLIPGMLNRTGTSGKYQIWGHDLGDLVLHTVYKDENTGHYQLGIDS